MEGELKIFIRNQIPGPSILDPPTSNQFSEIIPSLNGILGLSIIGGLCNMLVYKRMRSKTYESLY